MKLSLIRRAVSQSSGLCDLGAPALSAEKFVAFLSLLSFKQDYEQIKFQRSDNLSTGALNDVFTYVDVLDGTVQESRDLELVPTDEELGDSKIVHVRLMIIREDMFYADIVYGESLLADVLPAGTLALAFEAPVQLLGVKGGHLQQLADEGVIDEAGNRVNCGSSSKASPRAAASKSGVGGKRGRSGEGRGSGGEGEDSRDATALHEGHAEWGLRKAMRLKSLQVVLGGSGKDQAIAAALRGEFSAFNYGKLSILSFVPAGAAKENMWAKGVRSDKGLEVIASGLRNLDTWMQGVSCEDYEGASAELATSLTEDVEVWSATDNVLVLFLAMHMLAAFHTELRKEKYS
ncbi:hypothetical protein B484DRAFT_398023 [Ochromonadaceae sp. CCMP2298]|nr:hypothetical protein B484DRAFT_398023 [Ochromonadaceae sp. CCMP2298]